MFLRLTLSDVLIGLAIFGLSAVEVPTVFGIHTTGLAIAISFPFGALAYIAVAPLLYQLFRLRPLHYPACPHCGAPEGPWGVESPSAPPSSEQLPCGRCGQRVEFWYITPKPSQASCALPAFVLRWPRNLGLWRRGNDVQGVCVRQAAQAESPPFDGPSA
jgi:hypothetical protein